MNHERPSSALTSAVEQLSLANTIEEVTRITAQTARVLSGAEGTTFVLRDGDKCYYVDENAISPLWKGMRFPLEACISGWSMLNKQVVVIRDIYQDSRIPHDAYRPTFVKSLCMIPIRKEDPLGAIGAYWSKENQPSEEEIKTLQVLANNTAVVLENLELRNSLFEQQNIQKSQVRELELAVNSVAHDLRTPIAAMTGLAELIKMRLDGSDPKLAHYANCIFDAGMKATQQIERMLSLYRATNGQLQMQVIDLNSLISEVAANFAFQFQNRQVDLTVDSDLKAHADPALIKLVLENLFSNAIKYSSKKQTSKIHFGNAEKAKDFTTFFIKDNGVGFDSSQAQKLFQPLSRLHSNTEFAGTGLGLASVAKIIELHGGRVRAEGVPQEAATFYFSLPTANR